ncbi:RNA-directed DNA polymerase [Gossypium australe]|uniref:RNA-directed DNA polymerase n=1 Tax=Gossypium australe TaxID=47621 RepID=A0A5B6V707_9ROSI|nr:RNA-directed DNA polymerase [Gossypium australe]
MNGAVEAANKNIKKIEEKMTETYKDWHEKLPFALYAYQMYVRTSTEAIPFSLVYGMEALDETKWIQSRSDQLNLIEEKRLKVIRHGQMYQKRMIRAYKKKILPKQKDFKGKWMPNWKGPYVVKNAFFGGALILIEMDGRDLPNPVNLDLVKRYFT